MAETTSESALSEEELEYFRKKLLAMRDEIYAESAATVEEMQNESTLYPDPNDRASLEAEHLRGTPARPGALSHPRSRGGRDHDRLDVGGWTRRRRQSHGSIRRIARIERECGLRDLDHLRLDDGDEQRADAEAVEGGGGAGTTLHRAAETHGANSGS